MRRKSGEADGWTESGMRAREPERGHLVVVAHEQDVADHHRVVPGLALERLGNRATSVN